MDKIKLFFQNWKTSVPAGLAVACDGLATFTSVVPDEYMKYAHASCVFLLAVGLIGAKDADKTHSKVIVQPQPDPVTVPVEGADKGKVVPTLLLLLSIGLLSACTMTKGTMLDGRVCTMATNEQVQQDVDTIVDSYVNQADKARAELYLRTAKLGATALCEAARARQAAQAQGS